MNMIGALLLVCIVGLNFLIYRRFGLIVSELFLVASLLILYFWSTV